MDPFGRGPVFEQSEPSKWYGKKGGEDKNPRKAKSTGFKWVPGDVPVGDGDDVKKWQGYKAANGAVEEGLMAGSRVYPVGLIVLCSWSLFSVLLVFFPCGHTSIPLK